ncbi:MAG: glycoside hydrolase family 9 protein [Victivallaceae bacterium]|nr:glycoside hydrolase family 9 protein [Victivallaceae bacterium]
MRLLAFAFFTLFGIGVCSGGELPKLLAWYKLDGDFKDSSGNNRHLTAFSAANIFSDAPEIVGSKNLCFGPTAVRTAKYGAIGPELPLDNKKGFTICGFTCLPQGNSYGGEFFGCGSAADGSPGALLFPSWGIINSKVGKKACSYQRFADCQWHHYAVVVQPQGRGNNTCSVYVDGRKAYSSAMEYLKDYGRFVIGRISMNQDYGVRIDEVKVFDGALTGEQLKTAAAKGGVTLTEALREYYANKLTRQLRGRGITIGPVQRIFPKEPVPIKGKLKIHFLTRDWICVVGNYNDFIRDRVKIECGAFLKKLDTGEIKEREWSYNFYYNFNTVNVIASYRPKIKKSFENPAFFSLTDAAGRKCAFVKNSYWINAVGLMRIPKYNGELKRVRCAAVAHFAYLKLAQPLRPGGKYALVTQWGEKVEFTYDEPELISRTIKVNQIGYLPAAGRKYAYLGMWLAAAGPLKLDAWIGKQFYLINEQDNSTAYTGRINLRMNEQYYTGEGKHIPLNGEQVCEMDFSEFNKPGKYHIYVPGIGRSWSFEVSDNAVGRAFYLHIRGLYHQRSGIGKGPPFTNWVMGPDHMASWVARFSPEDADYNASEKNCGYLDQNGNPVNIDHFTVIAENRTDRKLPDVRGGWWDAGDFDRRTFHFEIVQDLLSAYFMFPEKFSDGQQHIPESGNGIPDIIDEAAWGVEVWRRAQHPDGGVGCWLEATSTPQNDNPAQDTQRYYNALPTRHSSMQYSAHAALLARAYRQCGAGDKAKLFCDSAARAFRYAINPANQIKYNWNHDIGGGKTALYSYVEPPNLPAEMIFKAALNLYILTKDQYYRQFLTEKNFKVLLAGLMYPLNPFFLTEILLPDPDFFRFREQYKAAVLQEVQKWSGYQERLAYRNLNFPPNHPFFTTLAWGNAIPFKKGRVLIMAYWISGLYAYRDAALLLNDWLHGCNPMGRSLPTGTGKNCPIRILSLPSYSDGILPPLPGITPYTYTFYVEYEAFQMVFALRYPPRPDHYFNGVTVDLMPEALSKGKLLSYEETTAIMDKVYPVWRRFANIERYAVPQNEFTVWETIGPCAACLACLLPDNWKPPAEWKNEQPAKTLDEMEGYLFQP